MVGPCLTTDQACNDLGYTAINLLLWARGSCKPGDELLADRGPLSFTAHGT